MPDAKPVLLPMVNLPPVSFLHRYLRIQIVVFLSNMEEKVNVPLLAV
jgi:hypothetical protein